MEKKRIVREFVIEDDDVFDGRPHQHHDLHHHHDRNHSFSHKKHGKRITKLIANKDELISYVNELGEKGHKIDIFKIEDDLYKVVVILHPKPQHD